MDPGIEYERMIRVFERVQAEYTFAVATGDPRKYELYAQLQRIQAVLKRYQRLAMQNI